MQTTFAVCFGAVVAILSRTVHGILRTMVQGMLETDSQDNSAVLFADNALNQKFQKALDLAEARMTSETKTDTKIDEPTPLIDMYIVATHDVMFLYGTSTLPILHAYAKRRGYGFHVVRNISVCDRHLQIEEFSHRSLANFAKVCIAHDMVSGEKEAAAAYDLDSLLDIQHEATNTSYIETNVEETEGNVHSDAQQVAVSSFVVIVDADVLVMDPHFDLAKATRQVFETGSSVLMLEDRSALNDYPGCYGNGPPSVKGLGEGVCLPQGSFIMLKRDEQARMFTDHWLADARDGPCGRVAREGVYSEQDTLKKCTIPSMLEQSPSTLRVMNGFKEIMTNELVDNPDFRGFAHFPLTSKSKILQYANVLTAKFADSSERMGKGGTKYQQPTSSKLTELKESEETRNSIVLLRKRLTNRSRKYLLKRFSKIIC